jgi:hypothetical protein
MNSVTKVGELCAACAALLLAAAPARALVILPPPIALRVAQSSTVVVGKVESIEDKTVAAKRNPNDNDKAEYQIAVVKIEAPILGAKGITHVRVGFLPPPPVRPGGGIRPPISNVRPFSLVKDQEVLLFLHPHFDGNFLTGTNSFDVVDKQGNANFEKEVAEAKTAGKLLADPTAGLKSDKQDDRYLTAAMLITQYRTKHIGAPEPRTEAVDAQTSKLVLSALAEANWAGPTPGNPRLMPQSLFNQLGVTDKNGFTPPTKEVMGQKQVDYQQLPAYTQQWLKDNAGKYRIQRFVYDEKQEKADK